MRIPAALAFAMVVGAASNDTFLIRNADVYPVTGPVMKGVSLLVQDGKIADIGPKLIAAKGVPVVDAKGMRVYPGIIDSGTQLGLAEISGERTTVDTGEIGEFMPQLRALVAVNPSSEHFPVVRANGITSAMTFPSSGGRVPGGQRQMISGQAAMIHMSGWTWEEMEITRAAAMHIIFPTIASRGGRGGPAPTDGSPDTPAAAATAVNNAKQAYDLEIAKLNQFFDDARHYQKAKAGGAPAFKRDLKFEALLPVLDGKVPAAVQASRATAIHDAIQFADRQKIKIVILEPREIAKSAAELKAKNIPVILGRTEALPLDEDSPYDGAESLPAEAFRAGVKFAFGTFDNEFVRNLPLNAGRAVAFGLPQDEALKAITINAAQIWGVADRIGSIEKGKWADLMIITGDPLEPQSEVKNLYIKGVEVDLSNKQKRLYEKYLNRP